MLICIAPCLSGLKGLLTALYRSTANSCIHTHQTVVYLMDIIAVWLIDIVFFSFFFFCRTVV
jgi:hypothetical protein